MTYAVWSSMFAVVFTFSWTMLVAQSSRHKRLTRRNAKVDKAAKDKAGLQVTRTSQQASCSHPAAKCWDVHTLDGTLCGYLCAACGAGITLASFLRPPEPIQAYPDPPGQDADIQALYAEQAKPQASYPIPPQEQIDRALVLAFSVPDVLPIPLEFARPVLYYRPPFKPPIDTN